MTAFEKGFYDELTKFAAFQLPTLSYNTNEKEEQPPPYKECVEIAARKYFGIPDPAEQQYTGYGVTTSKIGDKQVAPPYISYDRQPEQAAADLQKKWSTPGLEARTVGTGTREQPRLSH